MFDEGLRVAISDTLTNCEHKGEFVKTVLERLGEYETIS